MNKSSLGIHQVKLVIQTSPGLGDGGGVAEHADGTLNLGQISSGDNGGRLVVNADLESGGTPVNELDAPLGLDGSDGGIDILGHNISSVEHAAAHVLAMARVTFDHLIGGLKA